ncbi:MAG: hypothetical protein IPO69_09040 [Saprospiraceae bacterium]|nr:hypothetical protein [Saprospiraceae bacterium]
MATTGSFPTPSDSNKRSEVSLFSSSYHRDLSASEHHILSIQDELFTQSMISSHGVITGGGFETPAEAIFKEKN